MNFSHSQGLLQAGAALEQAAAAMIMLHGRGATAQDIISLAHEFEQQSVIYLAPQAANFSWYPNRFMAPRAANEPHLTTALKTVDALLAKIYQAGIPAEKTLLLGFSQGACLALEYAARNPQRYGGVLALSGGLIGAPGELEYPPGDLAGTPVFLGCSPADPHIPQTRVQESEQIMRALGAETTLRFYPQLGHAVNLEEIEFGRHFIRAVLQDGSAR